MEGLVFSAQRPPFPPPVPPDDDGGGGGKKGDNVHSFRDKLMGNKTTAPPRQKSDLVKEGLVKISHEGGNRLLPKVQINEEFFKELCDPWREALVINLLGKGLGFKTMQYKLSTTWKLMGGFDLLDIDNGFYMVKFDLDEDRDKVISGGPWMIFDHYLAVSKWSPDFVSTTAKIEKTMVWVRFPGMNLAYYDESLLLALASAIGEPIKVDKHTLTVERGRFVRVCVEIDLNQLVVGKICVRGVWYKVAYEGLHVICGRCGCCGHITRNCKTPAAPIMVVAPSNGAVVKEGVDLRSNVAENGKNQGPSITLVEWHVPNPLTNASSGNGESDMQFGQLERVWILITHIVQFNVKHLS